MQLSELNKDNTWQIGTGDGSRSYGWLFFTYGVAVVGPGDPGEEGSDDAKRYYVDNPTQTNWGGVLKGVKEGDWLIARPGTGRITGVGRVTGPMCYGNFFEDVEGWDLQHYVPVEWYRPMVEGGELKLQRNCLTRATLQGCYLEEVFEAIRNTPFERVEAVTPLEQLQEPVPEKLGAITEALINSGVRIQDAENVMLTVGRVIRLSSWYYDNDRAVLEHEIRAFLILPLLVALGWSEQRMKLEYHHSDIALFPTAFKKEAPPEPVMLVEAKTFGNGLSYTHDQLKHYADKFPKCQRLVTTNGYRFRTYSTENGQLVPRGYVNLLNLCKTNVLEPSFLTPVETLLSISDLIN